MGERECGPTAHALTQTPCHGQMENPWRDENGAAPSPWTESMAAARPQWRAVRQPKSSGGLVSLARFEQQSVDFGRRLDHADVRAGGPFLAQAFACLAQD